MHSRELAEKIHELCTHLNEHGGAEKNVKLVYDSLYSMGSGCLFDDMENEDEAKGAIKVLDWILEFVKL